MTKFNTVDKRARTTAAGPITSEAIASGTTFNGAAGYARNTISELFLLAVSNMVGEDTFYEKADKRDPRFVQLVQQAVAEGQVDWLSRFIPWLRHTANMCSASLVAAVEGAKAMAAAGAPGGRQLIARTLARADEPGEAIAYYHSTYGRGLPKAIKRGIGDAVANLYTEYNALKYDTASKGLRFGDVIELTHPKPKSFEQGDLFKVLLARGHKRENIDIPDSLSMLIANAALRKTAAATPQMLLNTARLRQAGMTWEDVLSLAGDKIGKKELWEALIPTMGFMALLRNLRNFDEAGIKGDMAMWVNGILTDPDRVAKSRQLPMRFLSAHRNMISNRWSGSLDVALDLSLNNVPTFTGKTLILIDTSSSMNDKMSGKSELLRRDAAVMFGLALARRCHESTVASFAGTTKVFPTKTGESLLKGIDRFSSTHFIGGGTNTAGAILQYAAGHERVIVVTDEQADAHQGSMVPAGTNMVTFNLGGYKFGHAPSGGVHGKGNLTTIGGLSDAAFTLLPALEAYGRGQWPF